MSRKQGGRKEHVCPAIWKEHWVGRGTAARDGAGEAGRGQIPKALSATLRGLDFEGSGKPMENLKQDRICV